MNKEEIIETSIWTLYEKSKDHCHMLGMYTDTDKNYRFYNGDQWEGLQVEGIEKVQLNFIKPIVKYKTGIILTNLYAINYSSENFENRLFRKTAEKICKLLNKKASKFWESDYMDFKIRRMARDSAINDEGVIYSYYDAELKRPINEVLNKNDILYGNENSSDIQTQPYILIKQRKPVSEVQELAIARGVKKELVVHIIGDQNTLEEAGDTAKIEKDNMCTLVTKFYKKNGKVYFSQATRYVDISENKNTGYTLYPILHMIWEDKVGSSRGEGEVRNLIPNQIETNKTAMRRAFAVKNLAYNQKVVNAEKIENINDLSKVGATIRINSQVDDINKIVGTLKAEPMSPDVEKIQNALIKDTRELAGAGEIATGQTDSSSASGRAILAVQQAAQQPLTEHLSNLKKAIEDIARIWLDIITVNSKDGIDLEDNVSDPNTGEEVTNIIKVPQTALIELQASAKIDVTPKSAYDKWAQEQSMENLLKGGYFSPQKLVELKLYVTALDDDSVMPKQKLLDLIKMSEEEQKKIAEINSQAMLLRQQANQFLSSKINGIGMEQTNNNVNQAMA